MSVEVVQQAVKIYVTFQGSVYTGRRQKLETSSWNPGDHEDVENKLGLLAVKCLETLLKIKSDASQSINKTKSLVPVGSHGSLECSATRL